MRLHALQYLRAFAALAVVYSHTAIQVEDYAQYLHDVGSFGVDIFFVISGFIMIFIMKPDTKPKAFMVARIRRVVPLYWFFTLLMGIILIALPQLFKATTFEWDKLLLSLAFIPHWSTANPEFAWPIVAPGWSLVFEMYFYLVFALSLLVAARYRLLFITAFIAAVFSIATTFDTGESAIAQFFSQSMVFEFIFGMLLAAVWKRRSRMRSRTAWWLIALGLSLLLLDVQMTRIIAYGVPALLIVTGCLYIRVEEYPWGILLGDASYSLYLSHIFTLGLMRKILPPLLGEGPLAAYSFMVLSLVICTLVSIYIHKYIDNWLLRSERLGFAVKNIPQPRKA